MKKLLLLLGLFLTFSFSLLAQATPEVKNLRVEHLRNPIGLDVTNPRFSWEISADARGIEQSAYEITVTSDKAGSNTIWTSGKIESGKSVDIKYAGTSLTPSTRYYWHVDVWYNSNSMVSSTETALFETGLMSSGWGEAKWIKATTLKQGESLGNGTLDPASITDYTITMDFEIKDISAGPCFAAKDANNFFMWQFNIETGKTVFRPHSWQNGGGACHEEKDITSLIDLQKGVIYALRIEIKGDKATTYINDIRVDENRTNPRGGNYGFYNLGFRQDKGMLSENVEDAFYDNIKVSTSFEGQNVSLLDETFSNPDKFAFTSGIVVDGRLNVVGRSYSWQKDPNAGVNLTGILNYTVEMDFEINQISTGPCFAVKDASNYYMWQVNISTDGKPTNTTYLRPHVWRNGGGRCLKEVDITSLFKCEKNVVYHLKIDIAGKTATTYINDVLVDVTENPYGENYGCANLGFRASNGNGGKPEQSYVDNIKLKSLINAKDSTIFSENFSSVQYAFTAGELVDGRLYVASPGPDLYSWQREIKHNPTHFVLDMDMTLLSDDAGILFSAKDASNMYMWSINTHDKTEPLIRRHIYTNGNPATSDHLFGSLFTTEDLIGKKRHVKIDVQDNVIKTLIDGILVDTYIDNSGNLFNGYVGFRAYNGNNTDEVALYDNIVLKTYKEGVAEPVITFTEDFENGSNAFEEAETVEIEGNTLLKMSTKSGDFRVLQGSLNGVPMFRTEFNLDKEIASAKIYASALGVYDLFINGQRVGTTTEDNKVLFDELKPGWTDYSKTVHYSTYDVTNLLKAGDNAMGAHVASGWWNGVIAHNEYGNKELSFLSKLVIKYTDGSTKTVVSDPTWLTSKTGPIRLADIYNGESYDARKESAWSTVGYNDTDWLQTALFTGFSGQVKAFVGPSIQVRPELARQPIGITVYEGSEAGTTTFGTIKTISVVNAPGVVQLKKGQTAVYDLGQNMVGWIKFTAKAASGTKMKVRFGEMLNDTGESSRGNDGPAGSIYTANYRSAKSTLSYTFKGMEAGETFNPNMTFFGFRYCEVTATADVEIQSLIGEVVGSATEEGSSFKSSSALVNQLYSNVKWGQRGNFLSVTTDCPQRDERLGWTGDTQIFSRAAAYNADVASFFHKWMGDMRDSQRSDGAYPDVAPHAVVGYGQGAWAEAGIIVPYNVYLMYGDAGIIEENFESMEKYMGFLAAQTGDGYLYNGAGTNYGDWVSYEATENRFVSVCYYAYAAQLMAKMSKALSIGTGDTYDVKSTNYQTLYNNIKAEFQTRYVNANGTLKQGSQTAYLLALKQGLFPNEVAKNNAITYLTNKIATNGDKLSTGFVGTGILNQTLSQFGATNTAYNLLLQRNSPSWLYSVDQGATTIWERWNSYTKETGFGDVSMNSFNHYSYGAVSEWMYRYMGGIETDEAAPGFKHFILQPMPDVRTTLPQGQERITSAEAKYASYYGAIKSAWEMRSNGNLTYKATVPANTTATLYLPLSNDADVVYEGEVLAQNAEGVTFVKKENGKAVYELNSGSYTFNLNEVPTTLTPAKEKGSYSFYPNPVDKKLTLVNGPADYQISDLTGKKTLFGTGSMVDVSNLSAGIYFIRIGDEVSKFIKN